MSYANARTTRLGYAPPDAWLAAQRLPVQRLDTPVFSLTRKSLPGADDRDCTFRALILDFGFWILDYQRVRG